MPLLVQKSLSSRRSLDAEQSFWITWSATLVKWMLRSLADTSSETAEFLNWFDLSTDSTLTKHTLIKKKKKLKRKANLEIISVSLFYSLTFLTPHSGLFCVHVFLVCGFFLFCFVFLFFLGGGG